MEEIRAGDTVLVKAQMEPGAFPDEYIVEFASLDGDVSGFVKESNAVAREDGRLLIKGRVQEVSGTTLTLFVRGSFFTNSGFVRVDASQIDRVYA